MVGFTRIAVAVVKLKIFKLKVKSFAYRFSIHKMALYGSSLDPYSPRYGPLLPKFSPELVVNKSIVLKFFEGFEFLWKMDGPKVCTLGPTSSFPLMMAEVEKIKYIYRKTSVTGLSKYVKIKALSPLPLPEKYDYLFH